MRVPVLIAATLAASSGLFVARAALASDVEIDAPPGEPAAVDGETALDHGAQEAISSAIGETPAEPASAPASGYLERSTFTTAVIDREPADAIDTLGNDTVEVAFFSDVRDMTGGTVIHRWKYGGEVLAEVPFDVRGPRWRVHSTKQLDPAWTGEWTVEVVDASGRVLGEESLTYTEASSATAATSSGSGSQDELGAEAMPAAPPSEQAPPAAPQP